MHAQALAVILFLRQTKAYSFHREITQSSRRQVIRKKMPVQSKLDELLCPYSVPSFIPIGECDGVVPSKRLSLAHLPTPIESFGLPDMPEDVAISLKRDDMTGGIELTGNKVRKLEFILAEALEGSDKRGPATRIYTAGGTQSNHARATVAACARLGLPVEVFLRKDHSNGNGNIFLDRLFGATVHEFDQASWRSLSASNPEWLFERAAASSGPSENIFVVPVGGSTPMGTWGYIEAVAEISKQVALRDYGAVVCTSGSGGTLAGLGLGMYYYNRAHSGSTSVVSYGICDSPQWFDDKVTSLTRSISSSAPSAASMVSIRDACGEGYSINTVEELQFISRVAREHGVAFDTCYTGKALYHFWRQMRAGSFSGMKVMYLHTGGGTSIFDKTERLLKSDPQL